MPEKMNNRRRLVLAIGGAVAIPREVFAEGKKPPIVIGWLVTGPPRPEVDSANLLSFKRALVALGRREEVDFLIDAHRGSGQSQLHELAEALAAKRVAVIVTSLRPATAAAAAAAPGIPVVQADGGSLIQRGLAATLARPGGMVTGMINLGWELSEKLTELLVAVIPKLQTVGYLVDTTMARVYRDERIESAHRIATRYNLRAQVAQASKPEELESAFGVFRNGGAQAIIVPPSNWFSAVPNHIVPLALRQKWPVVANARQFADAGALISYGQDVTYKYQRAAWYVDQILKGRKPGDLPVERPTRFTMTVNVKTAKALGITMPRWIMLHADRMIG